MSTKTQLAGGNFQDPEGNELANGYLVMVLSQDAQVNENTQVAGGRNIVINLDGAGNVITVPAQSVWGNDQLSPTGTYYTVRAYSEEGQLAWGPNVVLVTGSGGEFDVGSWVPEATNTNPGTAPDVTVQQVTLETNSVPNASQNTLNLISGSNVTLSTVVGGGVVISATGGGGGGGNVGPNTVAFSATPIFNLALGTTQRIVLTNNVGSSTVTGAVNGQVYTFLIFQNATGNWLFTWPTSFVGAGAIDAYDQTAAPNTVAIQQFVYDAATTSFYAVGALVYGLAS